MIKTPIPQLCQAQQRLIRWVLAGRLVSAADVAGLAEEVVAQGVAPALRGLRRQGRPTALAAVAALVETATQTLDLVGVLVLAGDDGLFAGAANHGVFPVEVCHTIHLIPLAQREALGADGPAAGAAGEAARVVALAQGMDNMVHDQPLALGTFLQRGLVAGVTRGATIFLVVALAGQEPVAGPAGEAVSVVLFLHRLHRHVPRPQRFVAKGTDISRTIPLRVPVHILPLRPARLLLAKCGRPQFGGKGRRGLEGAGFHEVQLLQRRTQRLGGQGLGRFREDEDGGGGRWVGFSIGERRGPRCRASGATAAGVLGTVWLRFPVGFVLGRHLPLRRHQRDEDRRSHPLLHFPRQHC